MVQFEVLLLLVIAIILGGLYQKIWYALRDAREHQNRVERLLAGIRDALQTETGLSPPQSP